MIWRLKNKERNDVMVTVYIAALESCKQRYNAMVLGRYRNLVFHDLPRMSAERETHMRVQVSLLEQWVC